MTDEWSPYQGIGAEFTGGHVVVNHGHREYIQGDAYTNSVESYFALLNRRVHGIFHHVSKDHLHRNCDELSFRWNHRKIADGARTAGAIHGVAGKRFSYTLCVNGTILN